MSLQNFTKVYESPGLIMIRCFQVTQTLTMTVPNEEIPFEHYLRQPKRLIKALTNPKQIKEVKPSQFRLELRPLQFMTLNLQPVTDLKLWTEGATLRLKSLDCRIKGADFLQKSFKMNLVGKLSAQSVGRVTKLQGKADLTVAVEIPPPLNMMPESVLRKTGEAFLSGILLTIKNRLERQLVADYRHWVQEEPAQIFAPSALSAESLAN